MFKFDDNFLNSVGLAELPETQKAAFLEYAQDQLEVRIGDTMSEKLTDTQLDEFEHIIDNDSQTINNLLNSYGDYRNDGTYLTLKNNTGLQDGDSSLIADYVTAKWLDANCPEYQQIIKDCLEKLKSEIAEQKDAILAAE
jgi:hypothetical protein